MNHKFNCKKSRVYMLIGLCVVLTLQSCMSLNTIFTWADTYISWEVDSYFDLSSEQSEWVDQHLDLLLQEYRLNEIPRYIEFLSELKLKSREQLDENDMIWFGDRINSFNANIATILANDVVRFLSGITIQQIHYLDTKLKEENQSWLEERRKRAERSEKEKLDAVFERTETWIGELTEKQKIEIANTYKFDGESYKTWYRRRVQSQQHFLSILKKQLPENELKAKLLDLYLNSENYYTDEYKEYRRERNERTQKVVFLLSRTATETQRDFFEKKLDEYASQLNEIAADKRPVRVRLIGID